MPLKYHRQSSVLKCSLPLAYTKRINRREIVDNCFQSSQHEKRRLMCITEGVKIGIVWLHVHCCCYRPVAWQWNNFVLSRLVPPFPFSLLRHCNFLLHPNFLSAWSAGCHQRWIRLVLVVWLFFVCLFKFMIAHWPEIVTAWVRLFFLFFRKLVKAVLTKWVLFHSHALHSRETTLNTVHFSSIAYTSNVS